MPSTYSPSLKLELIGTGEQAGTWGVTTNNNLGTLLEQAITGVVTLSMGNANYTMTNFNGLSDEARNAVLVLQGPITAPQYLIAPPQQKTYIIRNITGNTVTITTSGGNGVGIANSVTAIVYCDGVNFYPATTLNYIDGNLTVTGYTYLQNSVAMATKANATVSVYGNMYGNVNTGQWYIPTGTTAQRAATGQVGIFRYNSELGFYEGYQNGNWVKFITANQGGYTIQYLIVAGGGGGGYINSFGGGGGGGGVLTSNLLVASGSTYYMVVGGGGAIHNAGTNSSITDVAIAIGGGRGGDADTSPDGGVGGSGGSGGGGGSGISRAGGGSGVLGQGYAGGVGDTFAAAGGGGGGAVGNNGVADSGGAGGTGFLSSITGSAQYYAGGGGGAAGYGGAGGAGGGGSKGNGGSANTGGGGGGSAGAGGSGVIILSIPTVSYTGITTGGPIVSISGANTILRFNSSGTYTA